MPTSILIALGVLVVVVVVALARFNVLFVLRQQGGRLRLVRGRIPPRLQADIGDVLRSAGVQDAELAGVVEDGRLALRPRGGELPPAVMQRLRNTAGLWPLAKVRNAPRRR